MPSSVPSVVIYRAKEGATFNDDEAQKIGERIRFLERSGPMTPKRGVEDAKSPRSAFHKHLTWDNAKAGHRWRLAEMRSLINHIIIISEHDNRPMRAFHNVIIERGTPHATRAYVHVHDIEHDISLRAQVIEYALRQLEIWQERYASYKELFGLVDRARMEEIKERVRKKRPKKRARVRV